MILRAVTFALVAMAFGSGAACGQTSSAEVLTFQNWKAKLSSIELMPVGAAPARMSVPIPPQIFEEKDGKLCRFAFSFDHKTGEMARSEENPATLQVFASNDCKPRRLADFVSSVFPEAVAAVYPDHLDVGFWQAGTDDCTVLAKPTSCDVYGAARIENQPAIFRCHIWADDADKGWVGGRNKCEVFVETRLGLTAVTTFYSHTDHAEAYRDIPSRVARTGRIAFTTAESLSGEEITSWP